MYGEAAVHYVESGSWDGPPTHPLRSTSCMPLLCHG